MQLNSVFTKLKFSIETQSLKKRVVHLSEPLCFTILQVLTVTLTVMYVKLRNTFHLCYAALIHFSQVPKR